MLSNVKKIDFSYSKKSGVYLTNKGYVPFIGWDYINTISNLIDVGKRPDFLILSLLMWFEVKSTSLGLAGVNDNLALAHQKLFDMELKLNPVGGISCYDGSGTLYVAWIEIHAFNPGV